MSRILIFSPYASRFHITAYEGTIAKACQIRGAKVEYLLCDGLLPECDMHWDSFSYNHPRPFDLCQRCQAGAIENVEKFGFRYRWLGEFVNMAERESAFNWAQSLSPSEMPHALFKDYPVGEWVLSSVISYFRQYPPDMHNWRVANAYRGFLCSAAIVVDGMKNYLDVSSVDSALLYNGRQSITRVAFELLRQHGVRLLTHETPFYQRGHRMLKTDARCWSIEPFTNYWQMWGSVPLTRPVLERTSLWLRNRRYGKELSWYAFNNPYTRSVPVRKELNLSQHNRLLALFTSSTDETAGDPELKGPYELQAAWVQDVVNWVKDRKDVELVIRVHPHLAGKTGLGKSIDEFNFYQNMISSLPPNTRVIMPDDPLNSYALMDEADVCLSFGSSVGIEMAMLGKPVVLGSRAIYENCSYVLSIRTSQSLTETLEKCLQPVSTREIRREAFRVANYYAFEFERPFPLVSMLGVMDVKLSYSSEEALSPGKDSTLDHICGYLMDGKPLFDPPTEAERARTTAEEDDFFAELEKSPEPFRDMNYERWLLRTNRWDRLGRTIQSAIQRLPLGTGNILNRVGKAIYLPILRSMGKRSGA